MQLIFWNGPNNGRWNATLRCAEGHLQLNGIPGSQTTEIENLVREFGDAQEALPPAQSAGIEFVESLGRFTRQGTGNSLPVYHWVGEPAAKAETKKGPEGTEGTKGTQKPKTEKPAAKAETKKGTDGTEGAQETKP